MVAFGLNRLKQDESLDMSVPHKKRRVHFSDTSSCRSLMSKIWIEKENKLCNRNSSSSASSPLKLRNSVAFDRKAVQGIGCATPCAGHCAAKGSASEMSSDSDETENPDFEIPTKQQDGPSSVAQITDALVLHYLMKDMRGEGIDDICAEADEIAQDEIAQDTSSSDQAGPIHPADCSACPADQTQPAPTNLAQLSACPLDTELWPHVCARLQALARRLATTGRASLLPSASLLRPQHLPTIQFLASTIGVALGGSEQDPAALGGESTTVPPGSPPVD
mmetsp:Transcript_44942/g.94141  ORF Transcript_44942/g.94141 Transcript_44942/m.94141 type:complete len:278 (-) Transcript_44942:133-966(-)